MPKFNSLQFKILPENLTASSYKIDLSEAIASWEHLEEGKAKISINLILDFVDKKSPIFQDIDEIKTLPKNTAVIVLDVLDKTKIPMALTNNNIKFETDMSQTELTLTFKLAGKAGGTTGGKAGGTTEANFG